MQKNYCLPIIKSHQAEVIKTIQANRSDYQFFEVWLDYVENVDDAFIERLAKDLGGKLIVVFRRQNLEVMKMKRKQRLAIIDLLDNTPVLVDLDISSQTAELEYSRHAGRFIKIIASYHNYQTTPDDVQLREIIDTMKEYKPSVYKLATYCGGKGDALRLLQLLLKLKQQDLRVIVLGMGPAGVFTRIFGTLWGNEMVFTPVFEAEASAPGQLTRSQMEIIFKELGY